MKWEGKEKKQKSKKSMSAKIKTDRLIEPVQLICMRMYLWYGQLSYHYNLVKRCAAISSVVNKCPPKYNSIKVRKLMTRNNYEKAFLGLSGIALLFSLI